MKYFSTLLIAINLLCQASFAQPDTLLLSLPAAIRIANDSSLQAFRERNVYLSAYWQYNNYKAEKLPSVSLSTTPIRYNRSINKQYSINDSGYVFIPEQTFNSSIGLSAQQNLTLTGGTFYINSDLQRLQNMGTRNSMQFNSTWLSVGYKQPIFGFNDYKWAKKTEPLAFEKAKREYIESRESITLRVIPLFFGLAEAEMALQIARQNYHNADTLYKISVKRFELTSVDKADLLTLKLELINSRTSLRQAENNYMRSKDNLLVFLRKNTEGVDLVLPENLPTLQIQANLALQQSQQNYPVFIELQQQVIHAEREVEQRKIQSRFNASLDANFGLNKNASEWEQVYIDPLNQQMVAVSLNIPLVDWGVRKSRYNIARNNRDATLLSVEQQKQEFEQEMIRLVNEFNLQAEIVKSSKEAANIASESYRINRERFLLGRIDVNTLSLQQVKKDQALRSYISELRRYWTYYYQIRQLTLYDFEKQQALQASFDKELFKP